MTGLTNILWAPMAELTVSAAMAGLTNVLWAPMDDLTDFLLLLWAPMADLTDFPLLLWVPMDDLTDVSPSPLSIIPSTPTYLLRDRSVRRP